MPTETDPRYTLTELADLAGVTARTVRYYISQGLLAVDATPGPGPKYDDTHLARLRLIRRLQAEHLPLAEIRHRLEALTDDDVIDLVGEPPAPPQDSALDYIRNLTQPTRRASEVPAPAYASMPPMPSLLRRSIAPPEPAVLGVASLPPPSQPTTQRSQWERIEIAPDIELHIRRPLTRANAKQVERLIAIARDYFPKEHQP
jgi:DNA-binding transcriptional MerR regulator